MSCVSTPTATAFGTFTTDSVSTSFSEVVTELPPTTTTLFSTICSTATESSAAVSECSISTIVTSVDGGSATSTVPVPVTVFITSTTPTATLFSTSCASSSSPLPDPSSSSSTPVSLSTSSTNTPIPTPTPAIITSASVTSSTSVSDGSTIIINQTSTYILTPTSTRAVTPSPSNNIVVPIAAGVGGGVGALALLALVLWLCCRRRKKQNHFPDEIKFPPLAEHHGKNNESDFHIPTPDPYLYTRPTDYFGKSQRVAGTPSKADYLSVPHRRNVPTASGSSNDTHSYNSYVPNVSPPPPTTTGSDGSAHGSSSQYHPEPSTSAVTNTNPHANAFYPHDVKECTIYLRPDGYEIRESAAGPSSRSPNVPQPRAGASSSAHSANPQPPSSLAPLQSPLVVHQDGGAVQNMQHTASSRRPSAQESNEPIAPPPPPKQKDKCLRQTGKTDGDNIRGDPPPPAYSA